MRKSLKGDAKRARIVEHIKAFTDSNGYPPSIREIGEAVGLKSTSSVVFYLSQLREAGRITFNDGMNRTLRVIEEAS